MILLNIEKDSRQMPSAKEVVQAKNYCDLLYAWIQCHSERTSMDSKDRKIEKSQINYSKIEKDFIRTDEKGEQIKVMSRKTISKYFNYLLEKGLIIDKEDKYYYLKVLNNEDANLIEYKTLSKLMNVLQRNSISIYIYLFNRFYANNGEPFIATCKQIKDYLGIATTTTSNNLIVIDTIDILSRLGLMEYQMVYEEEKSYIQFNWIKNKLPPTTK